MTAPSDELAVGIVIPARDAAGTLGLLLDDLAAQHPDRARVVVVDDGSTDTTADLVAQRATGASWLSLVRGPGRGPAAARNAGAAAVEGPWLAFIDADVRLDEDWLQAGLRVTAEADADVVEGMVVPRGGDDRGLVLHTASSQGDEVFVTANLWVRRTAFEAVGGFDESYRVPWREDTDLGWRLQAAGARRAAAPGVTVFHPHARRRVRTLFREGARLDADTRLRARFPDRFALLLPRRGFRTTYAAFFLLLALAASVATSAPVGVVAVTACVAEVASLLAVRNAVHERRRPFWWEWAALAAVAPALVVCRVFWVARANVAHRQSFW